MATTRDKAQISADDLLEAAKQLSASELERLVSQLLSIQARRRAPNLSEAESELLLKINEGLAPAKQERFNELREKQWQEDLSQEEHEEFRRLINEAENLDARRVQALGELANLRQVPLRELMQSLGIKQPPIL